MRGKSTLLSLIALFSGLATSIGISRMFEEPAEEPVPIVHESILVAAADIDQGEPFSSENVKMVRCPCNRVSENCVRHFQEVKSSIAGRRLQVNEPITDSDLQSPKVVSAQLDVSLGRSVRLLVTMEPAVLDSIQPGSQVQVAFVDQADQGRSRVLLRSALLEQLHLTGARPATVDAQQEVSLRVEEPQVPLLLLAGELGTLHVSASDVSGARLSAQNMVSTVAELVAFAVEPQGSVTEPALQAEESPRDENPTLPAQPEHSPVTAQPLAPSSKLPVVKDIHRLGKNGQAGLHRGGLARVVTAADVGADTPTSGTQLTVSDSPGTTGGDTAPAADAQNLRE